MCPAPSEESSAVRAPSCVILAAGEGPRLSSVGLDRPVALTRLLGLSLAERMVTSCMAVGVRHFVVVIGSRGGAVRAHLERVAARRGCSVEFARAEDWEKGSGASARAAGTHIPSGPFLLVKADHLLAPGLLEKVLAQPPGPGEARVAVDRGLAALPDPEGATLVRLAGDRVTDVGKGLRFALGADAGVLYCNREVFSVLERAGDRGEHWLSDGLRELASSGQLRAVDVSGESWLDIDSPEIYRHARRRLLASLAKGREDGFVSTHLNRRLSVRLSERIAPTSITPNQLSLTSFALALVGAGLLALGDSMVQIAGALLVQVSAIFDGCDGEIARLKHQVTARGAWLDTILDRYADLAVVFAITLAHASVTDGVRPWVGGFVAATGFLLASYAPKEFALRTGRSYPQDNLYRVRGRDVRLFGIFLGTLFGMPFDVMVLLGILSHVCVAGIMLRGWRSGPVLAG